MISYHPDSASAPIGQPFTAGFQTVDTNDPLRIARGITHYAWSPSIFRDGYRNRKNFLFADWLGLDFEDPDFSLEEALNSFSDMIHVIGTTRRHRQEKDGQILDRFRVLIQLEYRCEVMRNLEATLRALARRYPMDRKCVDASRHFFPCREIISIQTTGYQQEVLIAREDPAIRRKEIQRRQTAAGVIPPETRFKLTKTIPVGDRNTTFYGVAKDLLRAGFRPREILSLIAESPTYEGSLSPELERELRSVIRSGELRLMEEVEDERRAGSEEGQKSSRGKGQAQG